MAAISGRHGFMPDVQFTTLSYLVFYRGIVAFDKIVQVDQPGHSLIRLLEYQWVIYEAQAFIALYDKAGSILLHSKKINMTKVLISNGPRQETAEGTLADIEQRVIEETLQKNSGSRKRAADVLLSIKIGPDYC